MTPETTIDPEAVESGASAPQVRLEFGAVVRRVALLLLLAQILNFWRPQRVNRRGFRRARRLRNLMASLPLMVMISFLIGTLTAVFSHILVRFVVQPLARVWYNPQSDGAVGSFHFAPGETVEASTPARRSIGRRWQPGTLSCTNQRLWFFPLSWEAEPWSVPLDEVHDLLTEPAPRMGLGFVTGLPDRVAVHGRSDQTERFAVPDPDVVLLWRTPGRRKPHEQSV